MPENTYQLSEVEKMSNDDLILSLFKKIIESYKARRSKQQPQTYLSIEKSAMIRLLDRTWTDHINTMLRLKASIHLRSYAQKKPLATIHWRSMVLMFYLRRITYFSIDK